MKVTYKAKMSDTELALWCFGTSTTPSRVAWEYVAKASPEAFRRAARANKVTEIVATNLRLDHEHISQPSQYFEILQLIELESGLRYQRTNTIKEQILAFHDFIHKNSLQVQFIKGIARAPLYSSTYTRCTGDIDIFVTDCAEAELLIKWLLTRGYSWDVLEFPWIKRWFPDGDGRLYGQVSLYKPLDSAAHYMRADIHFGAYSVGQGGVLPLDVHEHSLEAELVILLGHAFGDGYFRLKDLNDWRVLSANPSINWQVVKEQLASLQLSHMLTAIEELDSWQRRLSAGTIEPFLNSFSISKITQAKRAIRIANHTFKLAYQWESPLKTLKIFCETFFYYMRNHQLHVAGRFPHSPEFDSAKLDRWNCWRLIPVAPASQIKSLQFFGENFWPTIWYDVPIDILSD